MSESTQSSRLPGFLAAALSFVASLFVTVKHDVLTVLIGAYSALTTQLEGDALEFTQAQLEKLITHLGTLPMGTEILRTAEGWAIKVIGNGLPQHGFAADLLGAIEDATGLPSHLQFGAPVDPAPEPGPSVPSPVVEPVIPYTAPVVQTFKPEQPELEQPEPEPVVTE